MSTVIPDGALVPQDPDDQVVYTMDWDGRLAPGAEIATSTWAVEDGPDTALALDQTGVLAGNRSARVRVSAGTIDGRYKVVNQIVTNEAPAQTWTASFFVRIGQR